MQSGSAQARAKFIASMAIFGTIGIFVHYIALPSALISMVRGYLGFAFLFLVLKLRRTPLSREDFRRNALLLVLSGGFIGINWILLFEAYRYTSVAVATLCYYMQPVFLTLASPLVLHEHISPKKIICVLVALLGMSFVSGVWTQDLSGSSQLTGVLLGLGAALFYTCVILCNKKLRRIESAQQTMWQLLFAAMVVMPYVILTTRSADLSASPVQILLLLIVGLFHTGFAYVLYFGQMQKLSAQTVAILGYIDPVVAILLSALILKEALTPMGIIGAVLILGAAFISEI